MVMMEEVLFQEALSRPESDRLSWLKTRCLGDDLLRRRIEGLLAAHQESDSFLGGPIPELPVTTPVQELGETLDGLERGIGPYTIVEKLGEGGCGAVYLAEQTEPIRRRVALKVIKLGMDTRAVVARFEGERQALALMDHPHIAKVLDAGATERGRPFFVMEFFPGVPITEFCDQWKLTIAGRLALFIQVCQAIQHAHHKGIIHRDTKPTNILVAFRDGAAVPKVIDFGIAKAVEGRLVDAHASTLLHHLVGTPAYMSPEQAEQRGSDIDTRSDIYSLGVVLYELLAGIPPFDGQELLDGGIEGLRRCLRDREPRIPSARLAAADPGNRSTVAQRRGVDAARLVRLLTGDLDCIVAKCLEKDRSRRFATANGLAADLRRYLDDEPVVARPPGAADRIQRAFRRNRPLFLAGAAVLLALVVGLGLASWQMVVAQEARQRAEHALKELTTGQIAHHLDEAMLAAMNGDGSLMAEAIQAAEEKGASGGAVLLAKGWHAQTIGNPRQAIEILTRASQLEPDGVAVRAVLASAHNDAQNWTEFERVMEEAERLKPKTPLDYLLVGTMVAQDDFDRGLALIDRALELRRSPMALLLRANARATRAQWSLSTQHLQGAIADWEAARRVMPLGFGIAATEASIFATAAMIHRRFGPPELATRFTQAADRARANLESFPENPPALALQAQILEFTGREADAVAFLEELVTRQGVHDPTVITHCAIRLCYQGRFREALALLDPLCPANDLSDIVRMLAIVAVPERRTDFREALRDYRRRYTTTTVRLYMPAILWFAGLDEEASAQAREFFDHPPVGFQSKREGHQRACRYQAGKTTDEAYLAESKEFWGDFVDANYLVAVRELARGQRESALRHLHTAIQLPITDYIYYFARIMTMIVEGTPNWPPALPPPAPTAAPLAPSNR